MAEPDSPAPPAGPTAPSGPASAPRLVAGLGVALWIDPEAGSRALRLKGVDAAARARERPPLLCHASASARRLGVGPFPALDLLELFAFVRPARFAAPTAAGLAKALGLSLPRTLEEAAGILGAIAERLLAELAGAAEARNPDTREIAREMAAAGWLWGPAVQAALARAGATRGYGRGGLEVWRRLPPWHELAPPPPPGGAPVAPQEARRRLREMLGPEAETRPEQADYASAVTRAFGPRDKLGEPRLVLAEAGTGVGKTLGYLAPASLWAEANGSPVWISTFTRNLQHQIDGELDRLFPAGAAKRDKVVIRKGRENYLCLLNLEEALRATALLTGERVALGLLARWAEASRDGDMVGGDFPGWLVELLGPARSLGLADRRGECIYSACTHYGRCFVERSIRRARRAELVIANHALVMIQAAHAEEPERRPTHLVFDEGHHVFGAADSAFSAHLSGLETAALRRWLLGAEEGARRPRRAGGLQRRLAELIEQDPEAGSALEAALRAARALSGEGWLRRLAAGGPRGPCEAFLHQVRAQVYARAETPSQLYGLEAEVHPPTPDLLPAAAKLQQALGALETPLDALRAGLAKRLEEEANSLESDERRRIEGTCRSLERRALLPLGAWRAMLESLQSAPPPEFVDWLAVERHEGRERDVGLYRHWIDPTIPLAEHLLAHVQGAVITSATLTDSGGQEEADWAAAEARCGACHLPGAALRARVPSPFDYRRQTRVLVVSDLDRHDPDQRAAAYRELFLAAGGGALGLFTAIARLRAVQARIGAALSEAGLNLYAQHVDALDTSTLIDIFREEEDSCLLGTDAVRDGIDVPGRSLRLIVFDRVPWPRPDIRHRARRALFGGRAYDDRLTRLSLKQAFGRLVRRADDRGVFVLLDAGTPSRLLGAFPEGVTVERLGLARAVAETRAFLAPPEGG